MPIIRIIKNLHKNYTCKQWKPLKGAWGNSWQYLVLSTKMYVTEELSDSGC